jgi:imidazolonepropionase-like amidohydrolase
VWLLLHEGRIVGILNQAPKPWPSRARVLPAQGTFVTPGLIDPHVHLSLSGATVDVGPTLVDNLRAQLWFGVTTVVDAGAPEVFAGLGQMARRPEWQGPDVLVFSPFVTAVGSHPCEIWNDPSRCWFAEDERDGPLWASQAADRGVFGLKLALTDAGHTPWPTPKLSQAAAAASVAEAKRRGLRTLAHADTPNEALEAVNMGVDYLAHLPFGGVPTAEQAAALARATSVHTTFSAFDGTAMVVGGQVRWSELRGVVPEPVLENWALVNANPAVLVPNWERENRSWAAAARASYAALERENARIVPASDAGYLFVPHGMGLHHELEVLVELGVSPTETLVRATAGAADLLRLTDRGLIQPGLRADLLVLDRDPRLDVAALREPRWVVVAGKPWSRAELAETWRPLSRAVPQESPAFCLDDDGCIRGVCDQGSWTCAEGCDRPGAAVNGCGPDAWCGPEGACVAVRSCDLLDPSGTCEPGWYGESCIPYDLDTAGCWPAGPREEGESCGYLVPSTFCAQGLYCSTVDFSCYRPCDLDRPSETCGPRACLPVEVQGQPWFAVCAR